MGQTLHFISLKWWIPFVERNAKQNLGLIGVQMSLLPSSIKVFTSNIPANHISYVIKFLQPNQNTLLQTLKWKWKHRSHIRYKETKIARIFENW